LRTYKLILCVLISSLLFSHRLSSSHIYSADLSSCQLTSSQLFSAHSQIISRFLWPKICSKNGSWRQSKQPRRFTQRSFDTEKLVGSLWIALSAKIYRTHERKKIQRHTQGRHQHSHITCCDHVPGYPSRTHSEDQQNGQLLTGHVLNLHAVSPGNSSDSQPVHHKIPEPAIKDGRHFS